MKEKQIYNAGVVKELGDGRFRWRLTELKTDRDGEVVLPKGCMVDEFVKNPIVLFGHGWENHGYIPIGKIDPKSFEITDEYVDADVIFDVSGSDDFAKMIHDKVRDGFLNMGSIRFMPKEAAFNEPIFPDQTGPTFTKWSLIEFSVVPIPSNTGAVVQRSAEMKSFVDELKQKFPDKDIDAAVEGVDVGNVEVYTQKYQSVTYEAGVSDNPGVPDDPDVNKTIRELTDRMDSLEKKIGDLLQIDDVVRVDAGLIDNLKSSLDSLRDIVSDIKQ